MDSVTKGNSFTISKMEFFEEWVKHPKNDRNHALFTYISSSQDLSGIMEQSIKDIKTIISRFSSKLSEKWESSRRTRERFIATNMDWLHGDLTFNVLHDIVEACTSSQSPPRPGRPTIDIGNASAKKKRRRVDDLIKSRTSEELIVAAEVSSRLSGHRNVAKLIREISENPKEISDRKCSSQLQQRCLSSDEALAYYIDSKSTTHAYKQTRKWSMLAGHQVFPSYSSLLKAKKNCLPPDEHVVITETRAEIKLQAILDKTAQRLISAQRDVITTCTSIGNEDSSFTLVSKWGCDGSSGHSIYKQKFTNSDDTDEFLFVFSLDDK